ncbi:MAG: efflux RND transporter periplasmic adaptor subunit [candidate division Zixibacteria bacterium]|nr:efflux RND transporter periplasmic adaptor subunit [candidate division Zixibacteria bacterium]
MKKYIYIGLIIILILIGYYAVSAIFTVSYDVPTGRVQNGEFVISINTSGTIEARQAFTLSAPRIRGLQITWLAPEGSYVQEGDPVIRFDNTQQTAELTDQQSELKIKRAALERARQEHTIQEKQLTLDLEKARRNYDEKKHEALRIAEEANLELELAKLNYQAKLDQLVADVEKAEVEVQRTKDKVDLAQKELNQTVIKAPIPGMVVYLEIWKGSSMSKVQEGDSPWPGQGLVNLPDLSEMIVKTTVSEVDASRVDTLQKVEVVLDAFPDRKYDGEVHKKATLARKKDYNSKINVFEVEVSILEHDDALKPGMSASCDIILDRIAQVLSVPLEAVFEKEGETVVFMKNKKRRNVSVGRKNDVAVEIIDGLEAGDEICLVDPTLEEPSLPGEKATEPEINKGRNDQSPAGQGRRR